jgi:transcriptional regulator with XRE-family HTH domain
MVRPVPQSYAKAELVRRGIRQKDVAERLGLSRPFVSQVLAGHRAPPERFRLLVSELVGLPAEELFR